MATMTMLAMTGTPPATNPPPDDAFTYRYDNDHDVAVTNDGWWVNDAPLDEFLAMNVMTGNPTNFTLITETRDIVISRGMNPSSAIHVDAELRTQDSRYVDHTEIQQTRWSPNAEKRTEPDAPFFRWLLERIDTKQANGAEAGGTRHERSPQAAYRWASEQPAMSELDLAERVAANLSSKEGQHPRAGLASNPDTHPNVLERLGKSSDYDVQLGLADNPSTPDSILLRLIRRQEGVNHRIARRSNISPVVVEAIMDTLTPDNLADPNVNVNQAAIVLAGNADVSGDVLRRIADASADFATQRALAGNPNSPADLLDRFADEHSGAVAANPNSSEDTLTRLIDHPLPGVRQAAAANPNSPTAPERSVADLLDVAEQDPASNAEQLESVVRAASVTDVVLVAEFASRHNLAHLAGSIVSAAERTDLDGAVLVPILSINDEPVAQRALWVIWTKHRHMLRSLTEEPPRPA